MPDPSESLRNLLGSVELTAALFPPTSRYYGIDTAVLERPLEQPVRYLVRRFLPAPDRFATIREHIVAEGDRLDNITALYLGDPEQFWRICDANAAMRPDDLTQRPGDRIRITLPEGVPAPSTV
jgi:hypothetical protein